MAITEKYKFSNEIIKAFKIKDNKIHAFLPMVSVHPYEKTIREEPHANNISVIAEITAEAETEKYVNDRDSHIMLKNITITKTYYYEGMDNICFCSPKGWDEEVVSPFDKGISFVDKKETVYSLFPAAHGKIYRTLFSTRKEAELRVFGSNPKYEFVISKTDKATETETLNMEMYLPVEYTDSAMRRDGRRHAYREQGYLIFKPCKDAHIKKIDGYGHCILADKVIPIGYRVNSYVSDTIRDPKFEYVASIDGKTEHTPVIGKPIIFRFGMPFVDKIDFNRYDRVRKG